MKLKNYLLLDRKGGYPYGVIAEHKDRDGLDELHGPFATWNQALEYKSELRAEFSDYGEIRICKIEVPGVSS